MKKEYYKITKNNFHSKYYGKDEYLSDWPMVYILENNSSLYVGESTNVNQRMLEHLKDDEKKKFINAFLIYSDRFNQSVTFDFESKLIQYFAADGKYKIQNKNDGLFDKNYYHKSAYIKRFNELWKILQDEKLAVHNLIYLNNSEMFKYSPYKKLNDNQLKAVNAIVEEIKNNWVGPIVVNGMPGSGKTIMAIYMMKYLRDYQEIDSSEKVFKNKKIGLVIPQTSLRKTIKRLFKYIGGLSAKDVIGPSDVLKNKYDILFVDEAHRLHRRRNITNYRSHDANNKKLGLHKEATELEWILATCDTPILFYDENQVIGPWGIDMAQLKTTIEQYKNPTFGIPYFTLSTEMRIPNGEEYIDYVKKLLHGSIKNKKNFTEYDFKIVNNFKRFDSLLREKEKKYGLCRMVSGYSWKWNSKKDKRRIDFTIEGIDKQWNYRTENWINIEGSLDQVGCIHSIQGYDLNYCFVILGNDIQFDEKNNQVFISKKDYYDSKGKNNTDIAELNEYILNIYYVLMTRGIKGTYVYVYNDSLKKYLSKYIDVIL